MSLFSKNVSLLQTKEAGILAPMAFTWMTSQSWSPKSQLFIFPRGLWLRGALRCRFGTHAHQSHHLLCPAVKLARRSGASQIRASTAPVCPRRPSARAGTAEWTATATTWPTCPPSPSLCAEDSQTTERSQKVEFSLKEHKLGVVRDEHSLKRWVHYYRAVSREDHLIPAVCRKPFHHR